VQQLGSLYREHLGILLYRGVFQTPGGQAWRQLFAQLLQPHPNADACIQAYGDWFDVLSRRGQSWREYLIDAIVQDDNPFSQRVQYHSWDRLPEHLRQIVQREFVALEQLANLGEDLLAEAVTLLHYPLLPLPTPLDCSSVNSCLTESSPQDSPGSRGRELAAIFGVPHWEKRLPQLAEFYHHWGCGILNQYVYFRWQEGTLEGIPDPQGAGLEDLVGYDGPKATLVQNTEFLLAGLPAQNVLLYGSRGSGKSSLVKALPKTYGGRGLRLVEVSKANLHSLPHIVTWVRSSVLKFIVFVDDLSFEEDDETFKALKVVLEGNITPRPPNLVVYATSNRRHLVREFLGDRPRPQDAGEIHHWDTVQEKLSFSDRFGLTLTFEPADQDTYLTMVHHLAAQANLPVEVETLTAEAKQWATRHNGRSGRTARQFIDWCISQTPLNHPGQ
jgi:predicted AAA+ superfamily ATPase